MPDPAKLLATVRRATDLFRRTPGRRGGVVTLADAEDVLVVGDLHGQVPVFRTILELAALGAHPRRHLVVQELVHGDRMYPDERGEKSHQLVDLVAALKCQHPDRVHWLLGNHELSELTGRSIVKNGAALNALFRQGIETAYGAQAEAIYAAYLDAFAALPLAVRTPNRVFLCHTVPNAADLDRLDLAILDADAWPREATLRGGTVYALTWGRDTQPETADRFAALVDADCFVTGHHPCDEGFRRANHRHLILDGTPPCPSFCLFPASGPVTLDEIVRGARILSLAG